MDIVAHTLWATVGATVIHRRRPLSRCTVIATLVLAALPDVLHLLPIAGWWIFADGSFAALRGYAVAIPGQEPGMPPLVQLFSHNLHCVMHSAPIAGLVTLVAWATRRAFWIPLLGWWLHIVIDVFTHSAEYYGVRCCTRSRIADSTASRGSRPGSWHSTILPSRSPAHGCG